MHVLGSATSLSWFWLWHPLSGPGYQFWSGVGSDIGEITLLGAVIAVYRSRNCHVARCWRLGKHSVDGTPFTTCRRHHPTVPDKPSVEHIHAEYRAAWAKSHPEPESPTEPRDTDISAASLIGRISRRLARSVDDRTQPSLFD